MHAQQAAAVGVLQTQRDRNAELRRQLEEERQALRDAELAERNAALRMELERERAALRRAQQQHASPQDVHVRVGGGGGAHEHAAEGTDEDEDLTQELAGGEEDYSRYQMVQM